MKLSCVLTAVNTNKLYLESIPIFIKSWNILYPDVDVKIILIADSCPDEYLTYKDSVILFKPINDISSAFISQYIRLLYPAILNYDEGILITDIDIIPMNKDYFTNNITKLATNKFIYYGDLNVDDNQFAMCYNIATNKTWKNIFGINTLKEINDKLINVYNNISYTNEPGQAGWFTDQLDLYKYVTKWNDKTNNFIKLSNPEYIRLDRHTFHLSETIINNITKGNYRDYHIYRPYSQYKEINDKILELLENTIPPPEYKTYKIIYGIDDNYRVVTNLFFRHYVIDNKIVVLENNIFNDIFGDPCPDILKNVIIYRNNIPIITIAENLQLLIEIEKLN